MKKKCLQQPGSQAEVPVFPGWGRWVEFEDTWQKLAGRSAPWVKELSWFCGAFGCKEVTEDQLGRDGWAWDD